MAVVRSSEKIDTSANSVITRSMPSVPTMASPPTTNGSSAANSPPNTQTRTISDSGSVMASAVSRSFSDWSLISEATVAVPPASTSTPSCLPVNRSAIALACLGASFSDPVIPVITSPVVPSLLIRPALCGEPSHGDSTSLTNSDRRNSLTRLRPAAVAAGSCTLPGARTTSVRSMSP